MFASGDRLIPVTSAVQVVRRLPAQMRKEGFILLQPGGLSMSTIRIGRGVGWQPSIHRPNLISLEREGYRTRFAGIGEDSSESDADAAEHTDRGG